MCTSPPPNLFAYHPPRPTNDLVVKASKKLDNYLSKLASKPDIDSIAISVVTVSGPIFEAGYGVLRANESNSEVTYPVDRDSIYRIASITKMFTVLETLILRERGSLNWDDPAEKYLPEFKPPPYGWSALFDGAQHEIAEERPRITLRQLASHLAGIGRDLPGVDLGDWPIEWNSTLRKTQAFEIPNHSYRKVMEALSKYPLVNAPYQYPVYSNTGMNLLGFSNVGANRMASSNASAEPQTHKELVQRDIFEPLGLKSSFYRTPGSPLREHIAVPAKDSEYADFSFGDVDDPSGGQYSSLGDLVTLMKTFLSPTARGGVISAHVMREWLRPLYVWGSSPQQVGAPWEIMSLAGKQAYTKGGNIPGYHSEFAIFPEYSMGIIVLMTGTYADTRMILEEAAKIFLPTFEKLFQVELQRRYVGTWVNGDDVAEVSLNRGNLFLKKLFIRGMDVLKLVQTAENGLTHRVGVPVALWSTGRVGEFRLAFGRQELNNVKDVGCMPYWVSLDPGIMSRGAPLDLLYWKSGTLTYPSAGVNLARKR
ncbi:hypothetical protein M413DRAFT_6978 [Hebeloma cylindrosporum]|uniref:Beta-lactamase-related domain-containing protein n=1 Tax=Hebeloma cylindrosporum TaxID=76867 RepID=A0A0C2Z3E3_HEBCY|nr:hypothetical protein M413DRAFT_6978 [Hebeloma cylindrosporum h7]